MPEVVLHQSARVWGLPSPSPFCTKIELFLRAAQIPHTVANFNPMQAPRGKMPYVKVGSRLIPDSELIYAELCKEFKIDWDSHLTEDQRQLTHTLRRTLEDGAYFIVLWNRWGVDANWRDVKANYFADLPAIMRAFLPDLLRKGVVRMCQRHGIAKYPRAELAATLNRDIASVMHFMDANGPFFLGPKISKIDLTVFPFLLAILKGKEADPLVINWRDKAKAESYVDAIWNRFFCDLPQP